MDSKIISIGTALPAYSAEQTRIFDFMKKAYNNEPASRKLEALFRRSGIEKRHSVLPDFGDNGSSLFFRHQQPQPHVEDRMDKYRDHALDLALDAIDHTFEKTILQPDDVSHLITVTCTGLTAPGLNAGIINRLNLKSDIFNTSVNFMGCGAAFHALKIADFIVRAEPDARVLIVCSELCTLHFQPKPNIDNLLSNTIFNDGAAGVLVTSGKNKEKGLIIGGFYSLLLSEGDPLMGWNIRSSGFEMVLNPEIPAFIGREIKEAVNKAVDFYGLNPTDIQRWAIHPGGRKILDEIKRELNLNDNDLSASYEILRDFGNMSSPTILFVLKNIMDSDPDEQDKIFTVGFGPGLSVETGLFNYG